MNPRSWPYFAILGDRVIVQVMEASRAWFWGCGSGAPGACWPDPRREERCGLFREHQGVDRDEGGHQQTQIG